MHDDKEASDRKLSYNNKRQQRLFKLMDMLDDLESIDDICNDCETEILQSSDHNSANISETDEDLDEPVEH